MLLSRPCNEKKRGKLMAKGGNENRSENQIEIELGKLSNENLGEVR